MDSKISSGKIRVKTCILGICILKIYYLQQRLSDKNWCVGGGPKVAANDRGLKLWLYE